MKKAEEMIFDLQMFAEDESADETETAEETPTSDDADIIPPELEGLSEDTAREAIAAARATEAEQAEPANAETHASGETLANDEQNLPNTSIPYARFKEKVDETNELRAKLAEYEKRFATVPQTPQTQPQVQTQQPIDGGIKFTPEAVKQLQDIAHKRAMQVAGMNEDDVAALEYADDDDPRLAQWKMAQEYARGEVMQAVQQERNNRIAAAREFLDRHERNVKNYNDFAQKEAAEPDFQAVQNYAINDYFLKLPAETQPVIAEAYDRILRQTASEQDIYIIKNYYTAAKNDFRAGRKPGATGNNKKPTADKMPRGGNVRGSIGADGAVTAETLVHMAETTPWEKIPQNYKDMLMGISPIGG